MAIARKGARKIIVEGESYRWIVSPDDEPGLGIVVEKDDGHGQRLVVWVEHGNIVTPALVRRVILYALAQGWTPAARKHKRQISLRLGNEFTGKDAGHKLPADA
jgi:hypothetical protein